MPAGVHPHCATDRAWNADGPFEAGQPGRCGLSGEHGKRDGRTGVQLDAADLDAVGPLGQADRHPGESGVGDEQVRAATDDQHGKLVFGDDLGHPLDLGGRRRRHEDRRVAADAVRRQRPKGSSTRAREPRSMAARRRRSARLMSRRPSARPDVAAPRREARRCRRTPSRCTHRRRAVPWRGSRSGRRAGASRPSGWPGGRRAPR